MLSVCFAKIITLLNISSKIVNNYKIEVPKNLNRMIADSDRDYSQVRIETMRKKYKFIVRSVLVFYNLLNSWFYFGG